MKTHHLMVYRTNAYVEPKGYHLTRLDRLSYRLVGHYCLFTNIATALTIMAPIWILAAIILYIVGRIIIIVG